MICKIILIYSPFIINHIFLKKKHLIKIKSSLAREGFKNKRG